MEKKGLMIIAILALLYWLTRSPSYIDEVTQVTINYHIKYPNGGSSGDNLPLIIALHGNGDTYDNFYKYTLKDFSIPVRVVLLEAPKKYWPYEPAQLDRYSSAIASLSEGLKFKFNTQGGPVLLGYSGGGVMAYYSALTHCDSYSLVIPISGKLESRMLPKNITTNDNCQVLAFHGKSDRVVSYSGGKFAIETLKKYSKNISIVSFDEGHQGIFREQKSMILNKITEIF